MFAPMLASSAPATEETIARLQGTHFFDLKIDGVRGLMAVNKGTVKLTNRNGVDVTYRYPELVDAALAKFGPDAVVILDGEIAACDDRKLPSFKLTSKRDRQQKPAMISALAISMPVTFFAFDILYKDGVDFRRLPWSQRSMWLDEEISDNPPSQRIVRNIGSPDGAKMMELIRQFKLEGLVAKRTDSPYESGRRSQWVKLKLAYTASVIVTGREAGEGSRSDTFGALTLGMYDDAGDLVVTGRVGSGFSQAELVEIDSRMNAGEVLVGEVRFNNVGDRNNLRFPVWLGLRTDVIAADCQLKQLDGIPTT